MIRAWIGHGEPASGAKHARCLGKVLRRKNADEEVDGGVLHRPFSPHISYGEGQSGPSPRGLPCCIPGNIDAQADGRRR
jgi:hypothetical protein